MAKPDAVYWTGDLPPHNIWNQSKADQVYDLRQLTAWFRDAFPALPIFPAVGNHESAPMDRSPNPQSTSVPGE